METREYFEKVMQDYNQYRKGRSLRILDENTQHYSGNWKSPWRVVVIGKKQDLIASTLVYFHHMMSKLRVHKLLQRTKRF